MPATRALGRADDHRVAGDRHRAAVRRVQPVGHHAPRHAAVVRAAATRRPRPRARRRRGPATRAHLVDVGLDVDRRVPACGRRRRTGGCRRRARSPSSTLSSVHGQRPGLGQRRPTACTTRRGPAVVLEALDPRRARRCRPAARCAPSVPISSPPGASTAHSRSGPLGRARSSRRSRYQSTRPSAQSAASPKTRVGPVTVTPSGGSTSPSTVPIRSRLMTCGTRRALPSTPPGRTRYGALNAIRSTRSP